MQGPRDFIDADAMYEDRFALDEALEDHDGDEPEEDEDEDEEDAPHPTDLWYDTSRELD